jgi:hypothetical protein
MILNPLRRRVAELLEEPAGPGRTRADELAETIIAAAIAGDMSAARLLLELLDEHDEIAASAWAGDDEG